MLILNLWSWLLFIGSGFLWFYDWLIGPAYRQSLSQMSNLELMLTILSIICFILAITLRIVIYALKENQSN